MRFLIFHSLVLFPLFNSFACQNELCIHKIRDFYINAGENIQYRENFVKYFIDNPPDSPLEHAFFATAVLMSSEIQSGKLNQFRTFIQGKNMLDSVISANESIAEIRYLRFAVQEKIPGFLHYDNRKEDMLVILQNLEQLQQMEHPKMKNSIRIMLINSNQLTSDEKAKVNQFLP